MLTRHLSNKSAQWKNTIEAERLEAGQDQLREEVIGMDDQDNEEEDLEETVTRPTKAVAKNKVSIANRAKNKRVKKV
jgi:hypothetical protein